jgi:hypothetical protein
MSSLIFNILPHYEKLGVRERERERERKRERERERERERKRERAKTTGVRGLILPL